MEILINTMPNPTIIDIDAWLENAYPAVAKALIWETPTGPLAHANWTTQMMMDFGAAVKKVWEGKLPGVANLGLADPPANILLNYDLANPKLDDANTVPLTALSKDDAWALFVGLVAHSLVGEHLKWFPWSLNDGYDDNDLAVLFDSRRTFQYDATSSGYLFDWIVNGIAIPAPPAVAYGFLQSKTLIGSDRATTISLLLGWCRDNLIHAGTGTVPEPDYAMAAAKAFWQYPGVTPVSRMTAAMPAPGTDYTTYTGYPTSGHFTNGCHGTGGFLHHVLRTINLPAGYINLQGHAQTRFNTAANTHQYLSHCDDAYGDDFCVRPPMFDPKELLIDEATYTSWFINPPKPPTPGAQGHYQFQNLERRYCDLLVAYLPNTLLRDYCQDKSGNATHASGQVYKQFSTWGYAVGELEGAPNLLWQRMDTKLDEYKTLSGLDPCANKDKVLPVGTQGADAVQNFQVPASSPQTANALIHVVRPTMTPVPHMPPPATTHQTPPSVATLHPPPVATPHPAASPAATLHAPTTSATSPPRRP